ncbi:hypothetical protein [Nocardioides aurantiacus]|uniref:Uncharacterized protein n=1 Tax=Nocardioides aurantiacus TaxID=86796 RepID=A0A3N2CW16_9ACTN|nr:hypothetical protein [Nocardioides aurantiacus]ROR91742.1 hypothetical protein EDD33_2617 [Nocardioides aurantiacus]
MSETLRERQLRSIVRRIESEADTSSRAGQYASLNRIADDLREVIEGLAATAPTPEAHGVASLSLEERDELTPFDNGSYICACPTDQCPTLPCPTAEGLTHAVERILAARTRAAPVVHQCPAGDDTLTGCCNRSPMSLPRTDRITVDDALVTCATPDPTRTVHPAGAADTHTTGAGA